MSKLQIKVKKLHADAILPTQGSEFAAGYDLYSLEDYSLPSGKRHLFKIGLSIQIPSGYYGRIAPRSGLAYKKGIDVLAGVIDSDYSGEVGVILLNTSTPHLVSIDTSGKDETGLTGIKRGFLDQNSFEIKKGDRIAQIIIEKCHSVDWVVGELEETERNSGGFGSTGQ